MPPLPIHSFIYHLFLFLTYLSCYSEDGDRQWTDVALTRPGPEGSSRNDCQPGSLLGLPIQTVAIAIKPLVKGVKIIHDKPHFFHYITFAYAIN